MTAAEAAKLLHLTLPTTANALRTSYRRLARLEHPDVSQHPQAAERFRRVIEAHDLLGSDGASVEPDENDRTCIDGTPVINLGKGLADPMANAKDCEDCGGKGYTKLTEAGRRRICRACLDARFSGRLNLCRRCSGTGRFVRNGRDVGACFACKGRGRVPRICSECHGLGYILDPPRTFYHRCGRCDGCGEIRIFNPVLPKGLLIGS